MINLRRLTHYTIIPTEISIVLWKFLWDQFDLSNKNALFETGSEMTELNLKKKQSNYWTPPFFRSQLVKTSI